MTPVKEITRYIALKNPSIIETWKELCTNLAKETDIEKARRKVDISARYFMALLNKDDDGPESLTLKEDLRDLYKLLTGMHSEKDPDAYLLIIHSAAKGAYKGFVEAETLLKGETS